MADSKEYIIRRFSTETSVVRNLYSFLWTYNIKKPKSKKKHINIEIDIFFEPIDLTQLKNQLSLKFTTLLSHLIKP